MNRPLSLVVGVVLVLIGLLWAGQGLGWIGGSPMTVKAVLDRLIAQERVTDTGERPATRGRAAKLWKVA